MGVVFCAFCLCFLLETRRKSNPIRLLFGRHSASAYSAVVERGLTGGSLRQAALHMLRRADWMAVPAWNPAVLQCGKVAWFAFGWVLVWIHCCCEIVWILVRSRLQATRQALTLARSARQLSPSQPVNGSSSRLAQVLLAGTQVQGPSWNSHAHSSVCLAVFCATRGQTSRQCVSCMPRGMH